jgi:hypothetical protein
MEDNKKVKITSEIFTPKNTAYGNIWSTFSADYASLEPRAMAIHDSITYEEFGEYEKRMKKALKVFNEIGD